jgi:hypothetical protein
LTDKLNHQNHRSKQKPFKLTVWDWAVIGLCIVLISVAGLGIIIGLVYFGFRLLTKNKVSNQTSNKTLSSEDAFEQILPKCREIKKQFNAKFPDSNLTARSYSQSR